MKDELLKKFLIDKSEFTAEELEGKIQEFDYDKSLFEVCSREYLVLNEEEREERVTDYIKQSLWAFNASFLAGETGLPEEVFTALNEKCESGNEAIEKLIEKTCGMESFVDAATSADGYGHFLSPYDGEEHEITVEGEYFYIYRVN